MPPVVRLSAGGRLQGETGEGGAWPGTSQCLLSPLPPPPRISRNPRPGLHLRPLQLELDPQPGQRPRCLAPRGAGHQALCKADPQHPRENHHQGPREDAQKHQEVGDQERKETDHSAPGDANH